MSDSPDTPPDEPSSNAAKDAGWADKPDPWAAADREWNRPWPEDDGEEVAPMSGTYRPSRATASTVTRAYGDGMREAGPFLGLGIQIASSMLLFVGLGFVVDRYAGTTPWGVLGGSALGMVAIVVLVTRLVREANAESERTKQKRREEKRAEGVGT